MGKLYSMWIISQQSGFLTKQILPSKDSLLKASLASLAKLSRLLKQAGLTGEQLWRRPGGGKQAPRMQYLRRIHSQGAVNAKAGIAKPWKWVPSSDFVPRAPACPTLVLPWLGGCFKSRQAYRFYIPGATFKLLTSMAPSCLRWKVKILTWDFNPARAQAQALESA